VTFLHLGQRCAEFAGRRFCACQADADEGEHRQAGSPCTRRRTWHGTAKSVYCINEERKRLRGLRMSCEPKFLRFFQARFEPPGGRLM